MQPGAWWRAALALLAVAATRAGALSDDFSLLECKPPLCRYDTKGSSDEYFFEASGHHTHIDFSVGIYFSFTCTDSLTLEDPGLPRFKTSQRVRKVRFINCPPPVNASYAGVLATFNVAEFSELSLEFLPAAELTREQLAGLPALARLELYSTAGARLAPGALSAAPALRHLALHSVRTPAADLARLPPSLQTLKLWNVGWHRVNFESLPDLISLDVSENHHIIVNASDAIALKVFSVTTPNNVMTADMLPPMVSNLTLYGWNNTRPEPMTHCEQLEELQLGGTNNASWAVSLPAEWAGGCSRLATLHLQEVPLAGAMPARLLARARSLATLTLQDCGLRALPADLLDDAPLLTALDLSYNKLTELPSGMFLYSPKLESLNLSHNMFTQLVAESLSALTMLNTLHLDHNPHLGDLCDGGSDNISVPTSSSPLKYLKSLRHLYLSNTRVSRACRDWREDLRHLRTLDLRNTAFTYLNLAELQFWRATPGAVVWLTGDTFDLQYTRDDYNKHYIELSEAKARVEVKGSLVCDCNAYWTAMEFRRRGSRLAAKISLPLCGKKRLAQVDVDTLTCSAPDLCAAAALPARCTCAARDDLEHGAVVSAQCARAGLTELPRLPPSERKWRLHLAHNNISRVAADRVSRDILELDLRNNSITSFDGETAARLASVPLRLGGNRLECGCQSFGMLTALVDAGSRLLDRTNVSCTDGTPLISTPLKPCSTLVGAVASVLAVLLVAAVAVGVIVARPAALQRVKAFLEWLGCVPPRAEPDEKRRFDAFISYAHDDEDFVVEQLAARLEGGARPYRLCLHYRDWAPGEWIPAQIAASVRASRRTLAVVSRHYLESGWARAEFREATAASLRDATPRLVVVLLEDPAGLALDRELAAYVRHNTYVRWGDPWFWDKLRRALPPPRASEPAPAKEPSPPAPVPPPPPAPAPPTAAPAPARNTPSSA